MPFLFSFALAWSSLWGNDCILTMPAPREPYISATAFKITLIETSFAESSFEPCSRIAVKGV